MDEVRRRAQQETLGHRGRHDDPLYGVQRILRAAYHRTKLDQGHALDPFHTCPIPQIARLGRILRRWRDVFLAYFITNRSSNGGTEAMII